jgi:glycosyltransferase involved in cell wall biosynthesis
MGKKSKATKTVETTSTPAATTPVVHHYNRNFDNKYLDAPLGKFNWKGPTCKDRLALVMMIKNEEKRITVSFDSVRQYTNTFVILDTGSTDRTIDICREYCKKNNITLHLRELPFVNFEKSRNDLLDFADEILQHHYFMILLDCNDEVRNHSELVNVVEKHQGTQSGFHLRQQWWTGHSLDTYFNIRMVISHFGWRYRGVVHEYIARRPGLDSQIDISKCDEIILFQDRTKDDDKSMRRFKRDKQLLLTEHQINPTEPRTLFYLAQTCSCLNQLQEAYEYNLLRTKYEGFIEEVFHSYLRLGQIAQRLNHPWEESLGWFLKAYSHSKRAEPLVCIAEYYKENNAFGERKPDWHLAYMYIKQACTLNFPHHQILFIDKNCYVYKRWHLLGIIGYYVNRFIEGKEGCIKALMSQDTKVDMDNLLHYLRRDEQLHKVIHNQAPMPEDMDITIGISHESGDIRPAKEKGLGEGNAFTKEDIMKRARQKLLMNKSS